MIGRIRFVLVVSVVLCFGSTWQAHAQSLHSAPRAPAGWKKSTEFKQLRTVFTKSDLKKDETLIVKFYQRAPLETNQNLVQWMSYRLATSSAPLGGEWTSEPKVIRQTGNLVEGSREFSVGSKKFMLKGFAVGVDNVHARFTAMIASDTKSVQKLRSESDRLMLNLLPIEKDAATKQGRGTDMEHSPPKVKNLKAGGPIKPGRYVGNAVNLRDNKASAAYDLIVFENGEYKFLKGGRKRKESGRMMYSNASGRLNIVDGFYNSTYDPEDEYCVYGKEKTGKSVIYARDGRWQRKLAWVSDSDRPSPSEVARAEEIAKAEAERYKHVVPPGEGIRDNEIEAMLYVWETNYRSGAVQLDQEGFLLMKDGRVLDGLPVAPDSLDVAGSRSREPDRWGWWKKETDGRYTFAWPVRPRDYRQPDGKQVVGVPVEKGTRLEGDFSMAATQIGLASGYSSVRFWGIKLDKNGRFLKYRNGSTQSGGVVGMPSLSTVAWNDEGSVATTTGPSITVMSKSKKNSPGANRMGKYEFDGFRLTLTFDDGHTEHHATFTDKETRSVWFEGSNLSKKQKKKKK